MSLKQAKISLTEKPPKGLILYMFYIIMKTSLAERVGFEPTVP